MENLNELEHNILYLRFFAVDPRSEPSLLSIGTATGFTWSRGLATYLVTNWHAFSGTNHDTGKTFNDLPQYVEIYSYKQGKLELFRTEPLYDEIGKQRWLECLQDTQNTIPKYDLGLLPLNVFSSSLNKTLSQNRALTNLDVDVTSPLSIIGFPLAIKSIPSDEKPIWVTGYTATRPIDSRLYFFANAFPYQGMSGAPVFWIYPNRPMKLTTGGVMANSITGNFIQFVGIYSGRMYENSTNKNPAPLARIWKPEFIDKIIDENVTG